MSLALNLPYKSLWESIVLEKIKVYLAIENELITLSTSKSSRLRPFFNPDHEEESAVLSVAIERVVGSKLINIIDDFVFDHQLEILQKLYLRWYDKVA